MGAAAARLADRRHRHRRQSAQRGPGRDPRRRAGRLPRRRARSATARGAIAAALNGLGARRRAGGGRQGPRAGPDDRRRDASRSTTSTVVRRLVGGRRHDRALDRRATCCDATGGSDGATPFAATGVSIDTRTLQPGDLFVALHGETGDGHDFVADALGQGRGRRAGASRRARTRRRTLLLVDDTLAGLHALGGYARARFAGRLVAVTGSVGKTTTKEMLRTILAAFGRDPCRRRLLQQPLGRAADPGAHAAGRAHSASPRSA